MRFLALACDYDGTIASQGRVPSRVIEALEELKRSGRTLLLVTGRTREEWLDRFPSPRLFARVILENGALLFCPESGDVEELAHRPPPEFLRRLRERGLSPLAAGRVIVATRRPNETAVLDVIRELGLGLDVVFNKEAVMVLPSGVSKATGLEAALGELKIPPQRVVGVGDAENDQAFLELCGAAVAVANALPSLKEKADWVTPSAEGEGVVEVVRRLLADDFRELARRRLFAGDP
jgi:hydroxymethylpyrimidine pyrophosphatase-like HAD family hydrolase